MTYRSGISPSVAATLNVEPGGPQITCDGCGLVLRIREDRPPPAWFLDGKAAPGWALTRLDGGGRDDRCPRCRPQRGSKP